MTIGATEAGKHVPCEKPMATRYSDAFQMVDEYPAENGLANAKVIDAIYRSARGRAPGRALVPSRPHDHDNVVVEYPILKTARQQV